MSEEKRAPFLSDEDMYSIVGVDDFGEWRVRPLKSPFEIRDFYEAKITSGELMVVKTCDVSVDETDSVWTFSCCGLVDENSPTGDSHNAWNFCPGCGARIEKP